MTKSKRTLKGLATSFAAIVVCLSMLLGTTWAWFTDSSSSDNNIIASGSLEVKASWANGTEDPNSATWNDFNGTKIFDYDNWEPGYTVARHLKIENTGSLAFKYKLLIVPNGTLTDLADVIDVYVVDTATQLTRDMVNGATPRATLTELITDEDGAAYGILLPAGSSTTNPLEVVGEKSLTIALKMRENVGSNYEGKSIGDSFSMKVYATQYTYEEDDFGNDYDKDAPLDYFPVSNASELQNAINNGEEKIILTDDIVLDGGFVLGNDSEIDGGGYSIKRSSGTATANTMSLRGASTFATTYEEETIPVVNGGIVVKEGKTLELTNVIVDGGAIWSGEVNPHLLRATVNKGVKTGTALVSLETNSTVILGENAVLQNNDGANAVNLGTRTGGKLILNGGEILNNHSGAGAIWGGGEIVINDGKVNGNHGGIGGAIRVVTNVGKVLTMNGGEMNHNLSDGVGGAIWAGGSRSNNVYELNGGEMAYNYSPEAGGAIYAGHYETVKIGGTFKMHHNSAPVAGAIRFHNHASFVMTGGEIYENGNNSLFLLNNSASITGGKIVDTFGYGGGLGLTLGQATIDGAVNFDLSTNHNTAYLAKEFNTIKFTVNESDEHFANFNFKPADGYVYTAGDETKLVCENVGYDTHWSEIEGLFRIRAIAQA